MAGKLIIFKSLYSPTRKVQPLPNESEQMNGFVHLGLSLGSIDYGNDSCSKTNPNNKSRKRGRVTNSGPEGPLKKAAKTSAESTTMDGSSNINCGNVPCMLNQPKQISDNDQWKMKKRLTKSDVDNLCRLLLPKDFVHHDVLPALGNDLTQKINDGGAEVKVLDWDKKTTHILVFNYWKESQKCYILQGDWKKIFVKGRGLKFGDTVGLYWDAADTKFVFSVLERAPTLQIATSDSNKESDSR